MQNVGGFRRQGMGGGGMGGRAGAPPVTEKTFDEYHLYTLERPTTLLDHETKQVEFVQAAGIKSSCATISGTRRKFAWWNICVAGATGR